MSDYKDIVYENIDDDFAWGKYGDFKVLIMRKNGFINATKLCQNDGTAKRFDHWLPNKSSQELVAELEASPDSPGKSLIKIVTGPNLTRGTYAHSLLIPHIAIWASPKFAIKVSCIVVDWRKTNPENEKKYWQYLSEIKDSISSNNQDEKLVRDRLCKELGGEIEVKTGVGFIDILTSSELIEVKKSSKWKNALGQVLAYSSSEEQFKDHKKRIHLFEEVSDNDLEKIRQICDKFEVIVTKE